MKRVYAALATVKNVRCVATRFYTPSHEWIEVDGKKATIGITAQAQKHLGDIVFVALPNVGDAVEEQSVVGEVESIKASQNTQQCGRSK